MNFDFQKIDYPREMDNFVNMFLDNYDYNSKAKAEKEDAYNLFYKTIKSLLNTHFNKSLKKDKRNKTWEKYPYDKVSDLPKDEIMLLVKCLGHNIGVWDLHAYYYIWFCKS